MKALSRILLACTAFFAIGLYVTATALPPPPGGGGGGGLQTAMYYWNHDHYTADTDSYDISMGYKDNTVPYQIWFGDAQVHEDGIVAGSSVLAHGCSGSWTNAARDEYFTYGTDEDLSSFSEVRFKVVLQAATPLVLQSIILDTELTREYTSTGPDNAAQCNLISHTYTIHTSNPLTYRHTYKFSQIYGRTNAEKSGTNLRFGIIQAFQHLSDLWHYRNVDTYVTPGTTCWEGGIGGYEVTFVSEYANVKCGYAVWYPDSQYPEIVIPLATSTLY